MSKPKKVIERNISYFNFSSGEPEAVMSVASMNSFEMEHFILTWNTLMEHEEQYLEIYGTIAIFVEISKDLVDKNFSISCWQNHAIHGFYL